MLNGITTRSPGLMCVTSGPTSSTIPIGSCPRMSPGARNGPRTSYRCRSEPQMAVDVGADLFDDAHRLVPEDVAGLHERDEPVDQVQV